jgi:hypothetical protein
MASMLQEMMADSPIHLWKFDALSGTIPDEIGSLELDSVSGLTYNQTGPGPYKSVLFSNGKAKTTANNVSPDPTDMTVEVWALTNTTMSTGVGQTVWSCFQNTGNSYGGFIIDANGQAALGVSGSPRFVIGKHLTGDPWAQVAIDQLLTTGVWHHIVFTFENSTGTSKAYRNGTLENTQVGTTGGSRATIKGPVRFGGFSDDYPQYWDGKIGPAAVYNTVLSQPRIQAHYDALNNSIVPLNDRYLSGSADGGPHRMVPSGGFGS